MDLTTDMRLGQVVKSLSGRDKGRVFLVFEIVDKTYVKIVDGSLRGVDRPKLKKLKHLMVYKDCHEDFYDIDKTTGMNDSKIREIIKEYQKG